MSNFTLPSNVRFLWTALKALTEVHRGTTGTTPFEENQLAADPYNNDRDAAWVFIKAILDFISKANDMVNATEQILKAHQASIDLAKLLVENFLKEAKQHLLKELEERVEKESHLIFPGDQIPVKHDDFLEIINAGAKEWQIGEAILAGAEYLSENAGLTTGFRIYWTNRWIVEHKIIPTLRANL